jgi:hypothetical protein
MLADLKTLYIPYTFSYQIQESRTNLDGQPVHFEPTLLKLFYNLSHLY